MIEMCAALDNLQLKQKQCGQTEGCVGGTLNLRDGKLRKTGSRLGAKFHDAMR